MDLSFEVGPERLATCDATLTVRQERLFDDRVLGVSVSQIPVMPSDSRASVNRRGRRRGLNRLPWHSARVWRLGAQLLRLARTRSHSALDSVRSDRRGLTTAVLIRQSGPIVEREFEIEFLDSGVEAFAFTFG
jgi:hypothetical protein